MNAEAEQRLRREFKNTILTFSGLWNSGTRG